MKTNALYYGDNLKIKKLIKTCFVNIFTLISLLLISFTLACDPIYDMPIKNDTDRTLTIFFQDKPQGEVMSGKEIIGKWVSTYSHQVVEARDVKGNLVFSKDISLFDLHDAKDIIVIHQTDLKNP